MGLVALDRELYIYIGSFQRDEDLHDVDAVSYSANNLQEYFIDVIASSFNLQCLLVTPKKIFFKGGPFFYKGHMNKINHIECNIPYINFQPLKLIGVNITIALMILFIYFKQKRKVKVISFNAGTYYVLPIIMSKMLSIYEVLILADLPSNKVIDINFFKLNTLTFLGKYANKIITFNKRNVELFFSNKQNFLEVDFPFKLLTTPSKVNHESKVNLSKRGMDGEIIVSYSGSLSKRYSIEKLIRIFEILPDRIVLNLYGQLEDELISNLIQKSKKVTYQGFIENKNLINELKRSDFLIVIYDNLLDIEIRYPNRLIEYMFTGIPILVNCKESFPMWMREFINCVDIENSEGFLRTVNELIENDNYSKLLIKAQEAEGFVNSQSYLNNIKDKITSYLSN